MSVRFTHEIVAYDSLQVNFLRLHLHGAFVEPNEHGDDLEIIMESFEIQTAENEFRPSDDRDAYLIRYIESYMAGHNYQLADSMFDVLADREDPHAAHRDVVWTQGRPVGLTPDGVA